MVQTQTVLPLPQTPLLVVVVVVTMRVAFRVPEGVVGRELFMFGSIDDGNHQSYY